MSLEFCELKDVPEISELQPTDRLILVRETDVMDPEKKVTVANLVAFLEGVGLGGGGGQTFTPDQVGTYNEMTNLSNPGIGYTFELTDDYITGTICKYGPTGWYAVLSKLESPLAEFYTNVRPIFNVIDGLECVISDDMSNGNGMKLRFDKSNVKWHCVTPEKNIERTVAELTSLGPNAYIHGLRCMITDGVYANQIFIKFDDFEKIWIFDGCTGQGSVGLECTYADMLAAAAGNLSIHNLVYYPTDTIWSNNTISFRFDVYYGGVVPTETALYLGGSGTFAQMVAMNSGVVMGTTFRPTDTIYSSNVLFKFTFEGWRVQEGIIKGIATDRPAPNAVLRGAKYWATDTKELFYQGEDDIWYKLN